MGQLPHALHEPRARRLLSHSQTTLSPPLFHDAITEIKLEGRNLSTHDYRVVAKRLDLLQNLGACQQLPFCSGVYRRHVWPKDP